MHTCVNMCIVRLLRKVTSFLGRMLNEMTKPCFGLVRFYRFVLLLFVNMSYHKYWSLTGYISYGIA